ncbi:hypothetical protein [Microseira sp. BLCC-F43]|jgi:hypothetical protein|uniref:hypothetical protein n=1 Tax=Microseira sp. BLCC-F43 TaxID=3153602 RepID=UPI0035B6C767
MNKLVSIAAISSYLLFATASFSQNNTGALEKPVILAQTNQLVPVYRWWNPNDKDWITLRAGEIEDWKLGSWGYRDKQYSFSCSLTPLANSVAIYRWFQPNDKDWITITKDEIPDTKMYQLGYQSKTFQCYVSRTPLSNGVSVYRWFQPSDKDWINLPEGSVPEYQLGRWGYQDKTFQFYAWP